jgi:tetratricopeptide (TPR) repeat protein
MRWVIWDGLKNKSASDDEAVKIKSDLHQAWDNRGYALYKQGKLPDAIKFYDQAIEIKSDHANAWYNRACAYGDLGDVDKAIENLQTAINLDAKYREMAKTDADFDSIRNDTRFQALLLLESEFVSRRGATALRGWSPVVASGVRRVAESKSLRCLIFKFHILIQQPPKDNSFFLLPIPHSRVPHSPFPQTYIKEVLRFNRVSLFPKIYQRNNAVLGSNIG